MHSSRIARSLPQYLYNTRGIKKNEIVMPCLKISNIVKLYVKIYLIICKAKGKNSWNPWSLRKWRVLKWKNTKINKFFKIFGGKVVTPFLSILEDLIIKYVKIYTHLKGRFNLHMYTKGSQSLYDFLQIDEKFCRKYNSGDDISRCIISPDFCSQNRKSTFSLKTILKS